MTMHLKAGQSHTVVFPDAPPTLFEQVLGISKPAAVTVALPEDYTPERAFPLVLFMGGAQGDDGHRLSPALTTMLGDLDGVISLSMPTCLRALEPLAEDESNAWIRMFIGLDEASHLWTMWAPMLERVFASIPNIDRTRSVIGGFSNGANATAAVLSDARTQAAALEYFSHAYLIEGGFALAEAKRPAQIPMLLLEGEDAVAERMANGRSLGLSAEHLIERGATDIDYRTMPGVGHAFPDHEKRRVGNWIRARCDLPPRPELAAPDAASISDDMQGR